MLILLRLALLAEAGLVAPVREFLPATETAHGIRIRTLAGRASALIFSGMPHNMVVSHLSSRGLADWPARS